MRNPRSTSDDDAFAIALERFDLRKWCERAGFVPQGRMQQEWLHDCPWCNAEDKLSVNPTTKRWRCFVCARPFTVLDLVAAFEGSYAQAAALIRATTATHLSIDFIPDLELARFSTAMRPLEWEPKPIAPPEHYVPLTGHITYTARRNFDLGNMLALGVGVCTWGLYQDRLVFPVRRYDGAWVYFQTRATWEAHEQATGKYRKNLNPTTEDPVACASASDVLLGLEIARHYKRVALVEGPTDWLQAGPAAVATLGKKISDRQIQLLARAGFEEIDLCWDPDAWEAPTRRLPDGRVDLTGKPSPAEAAAARLSTTFAVNVVRYHPKTDPGTYTPAENWQWRMAARRWGDGSRLEWIP